MWKGGRGEGGREEKPKYYAKREGAKGQEEKVSRSQKRFTKSKRKVRHRADTQRREREREREKGEKEREREKQKQKQKQKQKRGFRASH